MIKVCVVICTYKRPEISKTLESLARQNIPQNMEFDIVIADNDETSTAKQYIGSVADKLGLNVNYIHAPARNISIARNACLDNISADWVAYIDDDEVADENWLIELYNKAIETNADVVLGKVTAIYSDNTADWLKKGDFHSRKPVFVNGCIETGYTGNTLCKMLSPSIYGRRFDISLGRSGGEDTHYFSNAYKDGAVFQYADKAIVTEPVPEDRASLKWLIKRKIRIGQTFITTKVTPTSSIFTRTLNIVKASSKLTFCLVMSLIFSWSQVARCRWIVRGSLHFGVIIRLLGKSKLELY